MRKKTNNRGNRTFQRYPLWDAKRYEIFAGICTGGLQNVVRVERKNILFFRLFVFFALKQTFPYLFGISFFRFFYTSEQSPDCGLSSTSSTAHSDWYQPFYGDGARALLSAQGENDVENVPENVLEDYVAHVRGVVT